MNLGFLVFLAVFVVVFIIWPNLINYIQRDIQQKIKDKDFEGAERQLRWALPLSFGGGKTLMLRGFLHMVKGDVDSALRDFNTLNSSGRGNSLYLRMRGLVYFEMREYAKSIKDFETALVYRPGETDAYSMLIEAKRVSGQLEDAMTDAEAFQKARPNQAKAYFRRGKVKVSMDMIDEAISDFTVAITMDDAFSDARSS